MAVFFLLFTLLAMTGGCAHRPTEEEFEALQTELHACLAQNNACMAEKARAENDLKVALARLEKARPDTDAGTSGKQELLDNTIACMEENRALLKQISRFKVLTQERKDAQWRLSRANEHLVSFLKTERMNDQLYIVKTEEAVKIIIPQRSLFPSSSSAWLMPKGSVLIKKIAGGMGEIKPLAIAVAGHTDGQPIPRQAARTYPTQWDLAHARAVSVLIALENLGVSREKLSALSFGDTRPIANTETEEGRAMNRRVEIVITP